MPSRKLTTLEDIEVDFAEMTNQIKNALCAAKTDVVSLIEQLQSITAVSRRKIPIFDDNVFEKISTIDDLWKKLSRFWNIYDYDVLIIVVRLAKCPETKTLFDNFIAKIDTSAIEGEDLVLHCKIYQDEELFPLIRVKVKKERSQCTQHFIETVKELVSKKYNLEKYSLCFKGIKEGCIELMFHTSAATMSYMLAFQLTIEDMADFAEHNIMYIQINEVKLEPPSNVVSSDLLTT